MTPNEQILLIILIITVGVLAFVLVKFLNTVDKIDFLYKYTKEQVTDVDKICRYMLERAKGAGYGCQFMNEYDNAKDDIVRIGLERDSKAALIISELKKAYYPTEK